MGTIIYFLRYTSLVLVSFIFAFLYIILFIFRPFNPLNASLAGKLWGPTAFKIIGIDVELRGFPENKNNAKSPCIFIGNHQHLIDIFLYSYAVPKKTVAIGKNEVLWVPFVGLAFWLSGCFLINRKNTSKAISTLKSIQDKMIEKKISVFIFPEGTRSFKEGLKKFKKGAFHMALDKKMPIIPIVTSTFFNSVDFKKFYAGKVIMKMLPPIDTAQLKLEELEIFMEKVRQRMSEEIALIDQELKFA